MVEVIVLQLQTDKLYACHVHAHYISVRACQSGGLGLAQKWPTAEFLTPFVSPCQALASGRECPTAMSKGKQP